METATSACNTYVGTFAYVPPSVKPEPSTDFVGLADKILFNNGDNVVKDFKKNVEMCKITFTSQWEVDRAFFFFTVGMSNTVNTMAAFNKEFHHGARVQGGSEATQDSP